MKVDRFALWISLCVFILVLCFVLFGPDDFNKLSNIFEKVSTLNITISIGYGALLAAIAALASHNTRQNNDLKTHLMTSVSITVFYILLNIIIFLISFLMDGNFIAFSARLLIGILLTILILYSIIILRISAKLIF